MNDIIDDLEKIDTLFSYFVNKLNIESKIKVTSDICWALNTNALTGVYSKESIGDTTQGSGPIIKKLLYPTNLTAF